MRQYSSLVIDQLETLAPITKAGVAHIYFHYQEQDHQTPVNVLSSLIKQLLAQAPLLKLPNGVEALYDELTATLRRPNFVELQKALVATMKQFPRSFFVFDALDEYHEVKQRTQLLPMFHLLALGGACIFVTSRPYPRNIEEYVVANSVTRIELSANEKDIRIYVREKIKGNAHSGAIIPEGFREEIVSTLVKCSKGM